MSTIGTNVFRGKGVPMFSSKDQTKVNGQKSHENGRQQGHSCSTVLEGTLFATVRGNIESEPLVKICIANCGQTDTGSGMMPPNMNKHQSNLVKGRIAPRFYSPGSSSNLQLHVLPAG